MKASLYLSILIDISAAYTSFFQGTKDLISHKNLPITKSKAYRAIILSSGVDNEESTKYNIEYEAQLDWDKVYEAGRSWSLSYENVLNFAKSHTQNNSYVIILEATIEGFILSQYATNMVSKLENFEVDFEDQLLLEDIENNCDYIKRCINDFSSENEIVATKVNSPEVIFKGVLN